MAYWLVATFIEFVSKSQAVIRLSGLIQILPFKVCGQLRLLLITTSLPKGMQIAVAFWPKGMRIGAINRAKTKLSVFAGMRFAMIKKCMPQALAAKFGQ